MTIEEMKSRKKELGYTNQMIAILSGVPIGTVSKIFAGITGSPRYDTIRALEQVLLPETVKVYEKAPDILIPKDEDDPEADAVHCMLSARLANALMNSFDESEDGEGVIVMTAPFEVQIANGETVQPDIFVIPEKMAPKTRRLAGVPEFIIEIATKHTLAEDLGEKQVLYRKSGVREYWVADIDRQQLIAFLFDGSFGYDIYSFDESVPIAVTGGKLSVDLAKIKKIMKW